MNWTRLVPAPMKRAAYSVARAVVARRCARRLVRTFTRAGLVPHAVCLSLPVEGTFEVTLPDGSRLLYACSGSDLVGRALYWRGAKGEEPETLRVFCELAREARLIIDVGANTGLYTLAACAANPECRVIAFEPVPHVRERLVHNLALNGWTARCEARCEALAERVGLARFHVDASIDVPSSSSFHEGGFRGVPGRLIEVPVATLDSMTAGRNDVDLVKIDVEGFEHKVLEGMRDVVARCAPRIILECLTDGPVRELNGIVASLGYKCFHLRKSGPIPVPSITPDPKGRDRNFLLLPDDQRVLLEPAACAR